MAKPILTGGQLSRLISVIANSATGNAEVDPPTTLDQLGFDSLDAVELSIKVADAFALDVHWQTGEWTPATKIGQIIDDVAAAVH